MTGTLTQIVAPATGLVTLSDAKAHLRVTSSAEDGLITNLIAAASAYLDAKDGVLGEALITQTWRYTMAAPPVGNLVLPVGPVQSIAQIQYVDTDGATQTVGAADYRLAGDMLELVSGASWPATDARTAAFWVDFVAGYGDIDDLPQTIAHLARVVIFEAYEQRGATSDGGRVPQLVMEMLMASARGVRGLF